MKKIIFITLITAFIFIAAKVEVSLKSENATEENAPFDIFEMNTTEGCTIYVVQFTDTPADSVIQLNKSDSTSICDNVDSYFALEEFKSYSNERQ